LFQAPKTSRLAFANNLKNILEQYGLIKKIDYVKDEGANLNAMIVALKAIVNCEVLVVTKNF
jgi:hypothetical protein